MRRQNTPNATAATDPLWKSARSSLGASLGWDEDAERMLLCCNDQEERLSIWELSENGWRLIAETQGTQADAPLVVSADKAAGGLRIIEGNMRNSWTLRGSTLNLHRHNSPLDSIKYARGAYWDGASQRLLVSAGSLYQLDENEWTQVPSVTRAVDFLASIPPHGLIAVNSKGIGARVVGGVAGEVKLPLDKDLPSLDALASGSDGSVLALSLGLDDIRIIRDGKVAKKISKRLGLPLSAAWHPKLTAYIVWTSEKTFTVDGKGISELKGG